MYQYHTEKYLLREKHFNRRNYQREILEKDFKGRLSRLKCVSNKFLPFEVVLYMIS